MNRSSLVLAFLVLKNLFNDRDFFFGVLVRLKKIVSAGKPGIDAVLELKLSLHKYYFLIIQKYETEEEKEALYAAAQRLFDDQHYHGFLIQLVNKWIHATDTNFNGWLLSKNFEKGFDASYDSKIQQIARFIILNTLYDKIASADTDDIVKSFYGLRGEPMKSVQQIHAGLKKTAGKTYTPEKIRHSRDRLLAKIDPILSEMDIVPLPWK